MSCYDKPVPLVPPSRTGEVRERIDYRGRVLVPLDEAALRATLRELEAQNIEALAVCLLFSFLHPEHETRVGEIAAEEMPGCNVSLSSEILPQIREYYRLSTTVINAYLQPILARHVAKIRSAPCRRRRYDAAEICHAVKRRHVDIQPGRAHRGHDGAVRSGRRRDRWRRFEPPIAFRQYHHLRHGRYLVRCALIKDGEPAFSSRGKIEGSDLAVPMMDINTVSAGGGTIARVDRFGVLEVGPHSAGAVPGPACYGRGGEAATITDCNLVLGYLSADNFLGGRMRLDHAAAEQAVSRVAQPLSLDTIAAAEGIVRIIDVKMEEAIKAISTMRGHDLRDFMLLAFGGAGPLHAVRMARDLGMAGVIVPLYPGVFPRWAC